MINAAVTNAIDTFIRDPFIRHREVFSPVRAGLTATIPAGDCRRIMARNVTFPRGICRQLRETLRGFPRSDSGPRRQLSRSVLEAMSYGVLAEFLRARS